MSVKDYNLSEAEICCSTMENTYCIYLHIIEGTGFLLNDSENDVGGTENAILVRVSLNGVFFEVLGNITPQNSIIFNNNCIWECDLDDAKKIKSDNRPIKLDCFLKTCNSAKTTIKQIGTLLLPLRSVKIIHSQSKLQIKPVWHNIHNLSFKWRNNRPQIQLILIIVKKTIINMVQMATNLEQKNVALDEVSRGYLSSNVSHTLNMLQPQYNIYVQLLEELGQIQVGGDPNMDCDVFCVTITFKTIKNISTLFDFVPKLSKIQNNSFIFQYDFLGSISNVEIVINNNDFYSINQKISLNFRSSLKSLRLYFQKIFYVPIYLYYLNQNVAVASYRFEISQFLPDDYYFDDETCEIWTKNGSFYLNRLNNISNIKDFKPSVEFMITLDLLTKNVNRNQFGLVSYHDQDNHLLTHTETSSEIKEIEKENNDYAQAVTQYLQTENSLSHKAKIKCVLWRSSIRMESNTFENDDANIFLHNTRTIGVNTEHFNILEKDKPLLQSAQDLDKWKQHEMERFMSELVNSKQMHLQEFLIRWDAQIARVEEKIIKCEQLNALLEEVQIKQKATLETNLKNLEIADNVVKEVELKYKNILTALEIKLKDMSLKAEQNENESNALKNRVDCLEKQLALFKQYFLPVDQLRDILSDMRLQAERFVAFHNYYKEKCASIEFETNKLKLKLANHQSTQLKNNKVNQCFDQILNEETLKTLLTDDTS